MDSSTTPVWAPADTPTSDIVVDLADVRKTYRQRQRSERWQDLARDLVHPRWREVRALDGVTLQVRRGEIVAYAGPNGAGKSTTIKLLAGLLAPDSGTVRSLGMRPLVDRVRYVGRVGVVFGQRTELWWDQPVAATFEWKRVVWDIPRERYTRMLAMVKELLGLGVFYESLARELSLGQRMRADLALALLHEPDLLLLDEPTLGLDVLARRTVLQFIKDLSRDRGVTVIVTSHDMAELEQLAGRIVLIDRGRLAYDGDFQRLRRDLVDHRRLTIETEGAAPPVLPAATLARSEAGRHEYVFDAGAVSVGDLLASASAQSRVLDIETHRADIDEVIADIYERWQTRPADG